MTETDTASRLRIGGEGPRAVAALAAIVWLPPIYAVTGFGLFDSLRSVGLGPIWQAVLFACITLAGLALLLRQAGWAHLSGRHAAGAGLLVVAAIAVNWDFPAKFVHVPQYAVLGMILAITLRLSRDRWTDDASALLAIGLASFSDELIQGYLSARTFGLDDLIVDLTAAGGGYLLLAGQSEGRAAGLSRRSDFLICCIAPGLVAVGFLTFVTQRASALNVPPPPQAFAPLAAAAAAAWLFAAFRWGRTGADNRATLLAALLGTAALSLVAIHGALYSLPLAFR
ncbi:MAG: VanZ family protein [Alphaproteobacteria bacterium]|nr:VanZ family protein [Alphaproteobacteria bacterium]MBO6863504.1 VanZ family protein [Alphaproteobacteria bacterium]